MFRVILKHTLAAVTLFAATPASQAVEVYFFKGAGDFSAINKNMHFSRGLERMADTLKREGIHAEVRAFQSVQDAVETIQKRNPESVAFVGHSMGALASMSIARKMKELGVRVSYMGLIDIPGPVGVAGKNVEWVENFYSLHPVYGRLTNVSSHPKASNIHVFGHIHTRMDDAPKVKNSILSAVRQIHANELRQKEQHSPLPSVPQNPSNKGTYAAAKPQTDQPVPIYNDTSVEDHWAGIRSVTPGIDLRPTASIPSVQ